MINIITPTGARPEAWANCQRYMMAQDYPHPVRWIIVDDGPEPQAITFRRLGWELIVVRPAPLWQPGQNTQARNLLAGLDRVQDGAKLVIIEDDDQVAPCWLSQCAEWLDHDDLVGEAPTLYRHVNGREKLMNNKTPSLCQTAMKGPAIERFRRVLEVHPEFIDHHLWRGGGRVYPNSGGVVGIKGLPGRPGIGIGHRM